MEGNIFLNFVYPWPLYTTTTKMLDAVNYNDTGENWPRAIEAAAQGGP